MESRFEIGYAACVVPYERAYRILYFAPHSVQASTGAKSLQQPDACRPYVVNFNQAKHDTNSDMNHGYARQTHTHTSLNMNKRWRWRASR